MGDSVDNVPGVEGIGPKTAADLVNQYGSLDGVLEHVAEIKGKKGQAIAASREAIETSRKLVRLREDVALGRDVQDLQRAEPDRIRLTELFGELEFTRLLAQIDSARTAARAEAEPVSIPENPRSDLGPIRHRPPARPSPSGLRDGLPTPPTRALRARLAGHRLRPPAPATGSGHRSRRRGCTRDHRAASAAGDHRGSRRPRSSVHRTPRRAGCGVAVLAEGQPYPRAALVGLAFALGSGARFYLPLGHRLLGGPAMLPTTEAMAALGPLLASPTLSKYMHDAKDTLRPLARARCCPGRLGRRRDAGCVSARRGRAPYELSEPRSRGWGRGGDPARDLAGQRSQRAAGW